MRWIFIGTAAGSNEPHRRCSASILEVNGSYYLIDMGTQVIEDLRCRGIDLTKVRLVACTHQHGDHTSGLFSFAMPINLWIKEADPAILLPSEELAQSLKTWLSLTGGPPREDLRIEVFHEGVIYEDENLRLTAIPTRHCRLSYAFFIEAEGKKLLVTGDLLSPTVDFPEIAFQTELDLIICETAHFSPAECIPVYDRAKVKRVLHTHINSYWAPDLAAQMRLPHPYELGEAHDGLEIVL
ncbi:MAG: MBL fold metallo-hydrolase [Eubacteriales bacterium]|nr:MBL fold metallo-hydrolase [Eubacteriales bacterium]